MDLTHRRIFKYELPVESRFMLWIPKGAEILSVGRQGSLPYLWAAVYDKNKPEQRLFRTATSGEVFNEERLRFVGHIQLGGETPKDAWYEWFIFEIDMALPQLTLDPIEDRFLADMKQARDEVSNISLVAA